MRPLAWLITWGSGGAGSGPVNPPGAGDTQWVHPEYSRPHHAWDTIARDTKWVTFGRTRADTSPKDDTFNHE